MIRIAHISDLHICDPKLETPLKELAKEFKQVTGIEIDLHFANAFVQDALSKFIHYNDPDVIVVSGDLTTFGDPKSFNLAKEFLEGLARRSSEPRKVVIVPGNHDVLEYQLAALRGKLINFLGNKKPKNLISGIFYRASRYIIEMKLSNLISAFGRISDSTNGRYDDTDYETMLSEFSKISSYSAIDSKKITVARKGDNFAIDIHPFGSVCADPVWMNLGRLRAEQLSSFYDDIKNEDDQSSKIHIAVIHHNPIASSHTVDSPFVNAYNSMPDGPEFLRIMQKNGVDIVLHGHQHTESAMLFDYDLKSVGHAYCIGSPSSTDPKAGGCNIIQISDDYHALVRRFEFKERSFFEDESKNIEILFEKQRPDFETNSARFELKRYVSTADGNEKQFFDEFHKVRSRPRSGNEKRPIAYVAGRRLTGVLENNGKLITDLLREGYAIRVLISNPALLRRITTGIDDADLGAAFWGDDNELQNLAEQAESSIKTFSELMEEVGTAGQKQINVRVSHTLLPFAATIRDDCDMKSRMAVKPLPFGALGVIDSPLFRLTRRSNRALFDYYSKHLKVLFGEGRTILGEWNLGDDDLSISAKIKVYPSGEKVSIPSISGSKN